MKVEAIERPQFGYTLYFAHSAKGYVTISGNRGYILAMTLYPGFVYAGMTYKEAIARLEKKRRRGITAGRRE